MGKFEALFEDEENIFGGTPKSKFWDIANQASDDLVKDEFDKIIGKYAMMETFLEDIIGDEDLERKMATYQIENSMELEHRKKSLYVAFTGDIVCRLDS